jgi:hypothetical protein
MIVLRPAVILKVVDKGTLLDCGAATVTLLLGLQAASIVYALRSSSPFGCPSRV